jgi:hypothetical protein
MTRKAADLKDGGPRYCHLSVASVVSTECLDNASVVAPASCRLMPANAAKMAALRCPPNCRTLRYHRDFPEVEWERPTCDKCGWAGEPVPIDEVLEPHDESR